MSHVDWRALIEQRGTSRLTPPVITAVITLTCNYAVITHPKKHYAVICHLYLYWQLAGLAGHALYNIVIPTFFGIRNLRLQLSPSGVCGLDTAAACSPFSRLVSLGCAQGCGWASLDRRSQPEDAPCRSRRPARRRHSKASTSLCVHPQV